VCDRHGESRLDASPEPHLRPTSLLPVGSPQQHGFTTLAPALSNRQAGFAASRAAYSNRSCSSEDCSISAHRSTSPIIILQLTTSLSSWPACPFFPSPRTPQCSRMQDQAAKDNVAKNSAADTKHAKPTATSPMSWCMGIASLVAVYMPNTKCETHSPDPIPLFSHHLVHMHPPRLASY
jgi:hypothetical protein